MTKEETLPDRQKFGLNAEQWSAFQKSLDAPPQPSPRLDKLLQEPSVSERGGQAAKWHFGQLTGAFLWLDMRFPPSRPWRSGPDSVTGDFRAPYLPFQ